MVFLSSIAFLSSSYSLAGQEDDYDRLDGRGPSGKRVDVIEWAGNLEIHVYPAGSLVGLSLQIDKKNKNKPVMVIGYRFNNNPTNQLIRRNIITVPIADDFKVYKDQSSVPGGYDKVIVTSNALSGKSIASFSLEPAQKQLYPDGHPSLAENKKKEEKPNDNLASSQTTNNSASVNHQTGSTREVAAEAPNKPVTDDVSAEPPKTYDKESGGIKTFDW